MWKEIFVCYNAAMTEKRRQILKIFSNIVINTNCLLLFSGKPDTDTVLVGLWLAEDGGGEAGAVPGGRGGGGAGRV